ncbi:Holliday junction recognition protein isoform X1 [Pteropus alecto]|uniref:Holliday junction recognition protein isoform X1 n=1 Tax=Pteropus alecto TaxID=9402 RepID=UPI000D536FDB|nr:Holliday junction recognition protein isoform X1 [Pteropus alecto]
MYLKGPISAQPLHASQWAARGADGGRSLYLNQDAGKGSQDAFLRVSQLRPTGAMESEFPGEDSLLQKLRDSHHRFQRHMQQLLEKYNQPFEDAPLVQMSTLTYATPQGLKVWGGKLVKKRNKGQTQDAKTVGRREGPAQATAAGPELPAPCTRDPGVDSESSDAGSSLSREDVGAGTFMPAVPWSPLKDDLRRKYLTQVDSLLQDKGCSEYDDYRDGNDTRGTPVPSSASPPRPALGDCGSVSEESPGGPFEPAASSRPCSTDMAIVPRNASVTLQATGGDSFSSNQSFAADDICSVTISDLYAGMLHSMSRLLGAKPASIISTKTFIVQNWTSRRRHRCQSRTNKTRCRGGRQGTHRSSHQRLLPSFEPVKEVAVLRDCQNVRDKAGLKLEKARLEVNAPQICRLQPSRKELKGTPQKCASLTYIDSITMHRLDQENRLMTLQWLISPVKVFSRRRIQQGDRGTHHRELANRFDQLYQEYCPSPRKLPCLPFPGSSRVHAHRASPGVPWSSETHRPRPFSRAKGKSLNEAFENLGKRAVEARTCLAKSNSFPSLLKADPAQNPGSSERTADLSQGNNLGILRKSVVLSEALSVPGVRPLSCARDRYDEIKEKFDKLHQQYCRRSPQQTKTPLCSGASPDKASVEVQDQKEASLGKLNLVSGFQGPQKLSASPHWSIKHSLGSSTIVHPSACLALTARRGPQPLVKRRRLSDPQVCGRWAEAQGSSHMAGRATRRPGDEVGSLQLD